MHRLSRLGSAGRGLVAWIARSNISYNDILDFRRVKALAKMFCGIKSVPKRLFDRMRRDQSDLGNVQKDGPVFLRGLPLLCRRQTADCDPSEICTRLIAIFSK